VPIHEIVEDTSVNVYHQNGTSGTHSINGNGNTVHTDNQKLTEELLTTQQKLIAKLEAENEQLKARLAAMEAQVNKKN
jgi:cell division protein FtsB